MTFLCLHLTVQAQEFVPSRSVETVDDGVIVTYRFSGGIQQADPSHEGAKFWKIPGFSLNSIPAQPCLPYHWDTFAVPDGADVSVTVLDSAYSDTSFVLAPAYPPRRMSDTDSTYIVPDIAPYDGFLPRSLTQTGSIQIYRGQRLVDVCLLPIQYDHSRGTLRSYSSITYKLTFTESARGTEQTRSASSTVRISPTDHFLDNVVVNKGQLKKQKEPNQGSTKSGSSPERETYLIISTNEYSSVLPRFKAWKEMQGYDVRIELRDSCIIDTAVKSIILPYYTSTNLQYVLIVGDYDQVTPLNDTITVCNWEGTSSTYYDYMTDYFLCCLDGPSDEVPDVKLGRIPVRNSSEADIVFDKIIDYSAHPPKLQSYYTNSAHVMRFEENAIENTRAVNTSEDIINYLQIVDSTKNVTRIYSTKYDYFPTFWNTDRYSDGSRIPEYLRKPNFAWDGNTNDIRNAINNGCYYVLSNEHGNKSGWQNPHFIDDDIDSLTNEGMYPVVFSISCETGVFNSTDDFFAETFLKKEKAGCAAIIAPVASSYAGATELLEAYMIDAVWPSPGLRLYFHGVADTSSVITTPVYELGAILNQAKMRTRGVIMSTSGSTQQNVFNMYSFHNKIFQLFGDPSMRFYASRPKEMNIPNVWLSNGKICVSVPDSSAWISFCSSETNYGEPTTTWNTYADYQIEADDEIVDVCIYRPGFFPYFIRYTNEQFVQNETISDTRQMIGGYIYIGRDVTPGKPVGDVIFNGANVKISANEVELHPGTTIINSNFQIMTSE